VSGLDWHNDALPVLMAVYRTMQEQNVRPEQGVNQLEINRELADQGRPDQGTVTKHALIYLEEGGYIKEAWSPNPGHRLRGFTDSPKKGERWSLAGQRARLMHCSNGF
jgi:hypothetical protein